MSEIIKDNENEQGLKKKKKRLGRGLQSLFDGGNLKENISENKENLSFDDLVLENDPKKNQVQFKNKSFEEDTNKIWMIPVEKVIPNKDQPRKYFDESKIKELTESIRQKGIVQPIIASYLKEEDKFEIIAGERRWRAAQKALLKEVPVILRKSDKTDSLQIALIENIQRQELNPIEEAKAYKTLIEKHNITQNELSEIIGKERATIANMIRLLSLNKQVQLMLAKSEISVGHSKILVGLEDSLQVKYANKILEENLSVRALEKIIANDHGLKNQINKKEKVIDELIVNISQDLQKNLGTKVNIDYSRSKGKIKIFFYSKEDFNRLVEIIKKGCQI